METNYFINRAGKTLGPFSILQIKNLAKIGKIHPIDLIKKQNGPWIAASNIKGLLEANNLQNISMFKSNCQVCKRTFQKTNPIEKLVEICPQCKIQLSQPSKIKGSDNSQNDLSASKDLILGPENESLKQSSSPFFKTFNGLSFFRIFGLAVWSIYMVAVVINSGFLGKIEENLVTFADSSNQSSIIGVWKGSSGTITFYPDGIYKTKSDTRDFSGEYSHLEGNWKIKDGVLNLQYVGFNPEIGLALQLLNDQLTIIKLTNRELVVKTVNEEQLSWFR